MAMTCRYCGADDFHPGPVNICRCGRSGSWQSGFEPRLIKCSPEQLGAPELVKAWRRIWHLFQPTGDIIARNAIRRHDALTKAPPS